MAQVSYESLGASLYVPADHKDLNVIAAEGRGGARSIIFCTEDAIAAEAVQGAITGLRHALVHNDRRQPHLRFVRPRNPMVLAQMLEYGDFIDAIDGVVLPKFDARSAQAWISTLEAKAPQLAVMPIIETRAAFTERGCESVLDEIDRLGNPVPCIRTGANDLLGWLGLKRQPGQTVYDTPIRGVIERLVVLAGDRGYAISSAVCDLLDEPLTFTREVEQDIAWGMWAKTCVHPSQIEIAESLYRQAIDRQLDQADALKRKERAVFKLQGQMMEVSCHTKWAERIHSLNVARG